MSVGFSWKCTMPIHIQDFLHFNTVLTFKRDYGP